MVKRLNSFSAGEGYRFLCNEKMAEQMVPIIDKACGEIRERDERSYGIVMLVCKKA